MNLRRIISVTILLFGVSATIGWLSASMGSTEGGILPPSYIQEKSARQLTDAIRARNSDLVERLLKQGADPNASYKNRIPLIQAIYTDSAEIIKLLLDYGANPRTKNALSFAVERGKASFVKLLLDKGADINEQNKSGDTPLVYAAANWESSGDKAIEIAKLLLDKGADPNKQNNRGETPIFKAANHGNSAMVELLLGYKADPSIKTKYGKNAIDIAVDEEYKIKVLKIFHTAGYPTENAINEPNELGETRLMRDIAQGNNTELIQNRIELGANPYLEDLSGLTAFDYAKDKPEILAILQKSNYKQQERPSGKKQESMRKVVGKIYRSLFPIKKEAEPIRLIDPKLYQQGKRLTTSEVYAELFKKEISYYKRDIDAKRIDITKLLERERKYLDDYYVFYHAQHAAHRIAQDFWLEILSLVHTDYPQYFIPVRFWGGKHVLSDSDPQKFLTSTGMIPDCGKWGGKDDRGGKDDYDPAIRRHLLSANIALFGNIGNSGESSFSYYLSNRSIHQIATQQLLKSIIAYFNFKPDIIHQLTLLQTSLVKDFGNLLQIFIPKHLVNECVYLSHAYGRAYTTNLGVGGYEYTSTGFFGSSNYGYQAKIAPVLEAIETSAVPNGALTKGVLDDLQARIVIGKDIMLNPNSGVKIFREVNLPKEKLKGYRNFVSKIALLAITDWLERFLDGSLSQEIVDRVKDTQLGQVIKDRKKVESLLGELRSIARDMLSHAKPVAMPA